MKHYTYSASVVSVGLLAVSTAHAATSLGTAMTYQGHLKIGDSPANGNYDMVFALHDEEVTNSPVGSPVQKIVTVTNGAFATELDFGAVYDETQLWLQVGVKPEGSPMNYTLLSPRQKLTAAPYASYALKPDGHSLDAADGAPADAVFVDNGGNVGVGTTTPAERLHIVGTTPEVLIESTASNAAGLLLSNTDQQYSVRMTNGEKLVLRDITAGNADRITILPTGEVGVGTSYPEGRLSVSNGGFPVGITQGQLGSSAMELTTRDSSGGQPTRVKINATVDNPAIEFYTGARAAETKYAQMNGNADGGQFTLYEPGGGQRAAVTVNPVGCGDIQVMGPNGNVNVWLTNLAGSNDNGWMGVHDSAGTAKAFMYVDSDGDGMTITDVIQINGGSDIAEPFDVSAAQTIEPGMVVAIDPQQPGKLRLSTTAYDRTVAGVISGAGGVNTGMMLRHAGTTADGEHPVALTGRVYCYVDADAGGPVVPGDLLTTSGTPGHAMRVDDNSRAGGAILGKAMSPLKRGRGLVLILVTLQ